MLVFKQAQYHQQQRPQHQQYPQYQQQDQQEMQQHLRQRQRVGSYPAQMPSTSQTGFIQQKPQPVAANSQNSLVQQQRGQQGQLPQTPTGSYAHPASVAQSGHRASVDSSPLHQSSRCEDVMSGNLG